MKAEMYTNLTWSNKSKYFALSMNTYSRSMPFVNMTTKIKLGR